MQELAEVAADSGITPQALANRPLLKPGLDIFLDAFFELNPHRQFTMGGSLPLSYTDKRSFVEESGYTGELRQRMMVYLREMDQAFLAYLRKLGETDKAGNTKQ